MFQEGMQKICRAIESFSHLAIDAGHGKSSKHPDKYQLILLSDGRLGMIGETYIFRDIPPGALISAAIAAKEKEQATQKMDLSSLQSLLEQNKLPPWFR